MIRQVLFLSAYAPRDKYCFHVFKLCRRLHSNTKLSNPLSSYQLKIANGNLTPDDHQHQVVLKLQRVYDEIQNYRPSKKRWIFKFFSLKKSVSTPRGVYLYGAVGGGKTMLMDLFYKCCKVRTNF